MQEIIYKLDNWSIIKLFGGLSIILIAFIGFFSKIFYKKIIQSSQHLYDKKIEDLKGEIIKSNNSLNSIIQDFF